MTQGTPRHGCHALKEDNHRAYWTLDVRYPDKPPPSPTDGGMCIADNAGCDR